VLDREVRRRLAHGGKVAADQARRLDHLHRHRRVVEVLACHTQVDVARLGLADGLVEHSKKGDHVVADA